MEQNETMHCEENELQVIVRTVADEYNQITKECVHWQWQIKMNGGNDNGNAID